MTKGIWGRLTSSGLGRLPPPGSARWRAWRALQNANTRLYRLSGGRVGGSYDGAPVLILHHVGRKSGQPRETPLLYLPDGDDLVVVGSVAGRPTHPAWYLNVRERPDVEVEIRGRRIPVRARDAAAGERERLWPRLLEIWPAWADYAQRTEREFPILILEPRRGGSGPFG